MKMFVTKKRGSFFAPRPHFLAVKVTLSHSQLHIFTLSHLKLLLYPTPTYSHSTFTSNRFVFTYLSRGIITKRMCAILVQIAPLSINSLKSHCSNIANFAKHSNISVFASVTVKYKNDVFLP